MKGISADVAQIRDQFAPPPPEPEPAPKPKAKKKAKPRKKPAAKKG